MSTTTHESATDFSTSPRELLGLGQIDIEGVAHQLDAMREDQRVAFVRALHKGDMMRLWDACRGRVVSAADFVPDELGSRAEVLHQGKNSLPLFSRFQKRFAKGDRPEVVYGYNHNDFNWTTAGPGYFIGHIEVRARAGEQQDVFALDYYEVPPAGAALPLGWPKVRRNEIGLQCFIYARMVDYMRKVSEGLTIGRAWKYGRGTSNYFVLARTTR